MKQHKRFSAVAVFCLMVVFALPMSTVLGSVSGSLQLTPGPGGNYYNDYQNSLYADQMYVILTAPGLSLNHYQTYGYCVDFWQDCGSGSYHVELTALSDLGDDAYYDVAWLLDTYAGQTGVTSNIQAMALQSLSWATLTGDEPMCRPSDSDSPLVRQQYDTYDAALAALTLDQTTKDYLETRYRVAFSGTYQDIMVRLPGPNTIPAPASIALLGTGLSWLTMRRRRKSLGLA